MNEKTTTLEPSANAATNPPQAKSLACRFCGSETFTVIDLGDLPFANALVKDPSEPVETYPTALHVCSNCSTAQLSFCADQNILYRDYVYITPESAMLSEHYQKIVDYLMGKKYFDSSANVLEVGSNIGRFLKHLKPFVKSVVGVDPARNIAAMAEEQGVPTISEFFNAETAREIANKRGKMDLVVARHCFAHNEMPWLMLEGVAELLAPEGVFVVENAYFPDTVEKREFDQIYHEHMYYYNLRAIRQLMQKYGFKLIDGYHSPIHGGTMLYIVKRATATGDLTGEAKHFLELEKDMHKPSYYEPFINDIERNRLQLRDIVGKVKAEGKTVYAYGASAKSTTLLNYFGLDNTMIPYIVDSTITKHGKYIPLANIKVMSEEEAQQNHPDYYLLTIWNYKDEIIRKVRASGNLKSKFIIPHPKVEIID